MKVEKSFCRYTKNTLSGYSYKKTSIFCNYLWLNLMFPLFFGIVSSVKVDKTQIFNFLDVPKETSKSFHEYHVVHHSGKITLPIKMIRLICSIILFCKATEPVLTDIFNHLPRFMTSTQIKETKENILAKYENAKKELEGELSLMVIDGDPNFVNRTPESDLDAGQSFTSLQESFIHNTVLEIITKSEDHLQLSFHEQAHISQKCENHHQQRVLRIAINFLSSAKEEKDRSLLDVATWVPDKGFVSNLIPQICSIYRSLNIRLWLIMFISFVMLIDLVLGLK